MSIKDSYVINILPGSDPNKENSFTQNNKPKGGLPEEEIIRRYREYANKFKENPTEWPNKRHQTTCTDIENGCVIRKLYDKELSDREIIAIINKDFHGFNSHESVLIDYITPADEYGYLFMNYTPTIMNYTTTSIFSGLLSKYRRGGKSHKKRKSRKPRKLRKSHKSRK